MEPFGLLNLLQSLLPTAENPPQPSPKQAGDDWAIPSAETTEISTENPASVPPETPPQNAFLDFVSRHDERKRQIKKP